MNNDMPILKDAKNRHSSTSAANVWKKMLCKGNINIFIYSLRAKTILIFTYTRVPRVVLKIIYFTVKLLNSSYLISTTFYKKIFHKSRTI